MPEKPLTVATYAAGASLAAITLFYVFAPNYFIDGDSNAKGKKGVVVGLSNPANDCFINSVLQALAGLTDLRIYLIRENHRRNIDEPWVYQEIVKHPAYRNTPEWKIHGLQAGLVTQGLKNILDSLNERPIYKKTISATPFIKVLENAFRQRISRQQQDAQEFLQVVAERLCDEYHAGRRARQAAKKKSAAEASANKAEPIDGDAVEERLARLATGEDTSTNTAESNERTPEAEIEDEEGFPMEGKYESQIECQTCGYKTKPTESTFCTLTLNVPQSNSSSLNSCLDGFFKTEYVDDFKCEKCRLVYARDILELRKTHSHSESFKASAQEAIAKLQHAIDNNPEDPPPDVELPPMRDAPTCRIAKHTRLTGFPKIMAIHLSRSIYNSISQKNSAKVSFPEQLLMGTLLNRKKYKLLGTVTHKGSHHSGHYESFRRQNVSLPFSTPNAFQASMAFTKSATPSPASTPRVAAMQKSGEPSPVASTPDLVASSPGASSPNQSIDGFPRPSTDSIPTPQGSSTSNSRSTFRRSPTSSTKDRESDTISLKSVAASARSTMSRISHSARNSRPGSPNKTPVAPSTANGKAIPPKTKANKPKRQKPNERWWRISDEKIKEAKTSEVLGMQREVYLLFYELDRESPAES
ncbi:cysteine proteinase [Annulohypoxylon truncatum]|uniref:cysteine proteinase n=1 Tax=Annulohypoxylon truncatum TaxID=327061 RepID=UPI0020078533|nr:cysteine proteinase [Annulohypoxylon truncatum]KAI1209378.1 cysteine proteinase [Annulohypoxylon truncatum]